MAIGWGVIGCGGIAKRRTIPEGIAKAKNSRLIAVMDALRPAADEVGGRFGAKVYPNEAELLRDPRVDAVYIATPTHLHARQTLQAARAGRHVLCEKPMAMSLVDARRMMKACRKAKVKLSFGYMMRYHGLHRRIAEIIRSGALGKLVMGRAQLACWYPPIPGAWRQNPLQGGGGSLVDMGTHCLDLLEMFLGAIAEVQCFKGRLVHAYKSEDTAVALFRHQSGALSVIDNHFNVPDAAVDNVLELYGSKGSIRAKGSIGQAPTGEAVAMIEREGKGYEAAQERAAPAPEPVSFEPVNTYEAEISAFAEAIEKGQDPPITPDHAYHNLEVVLACYKSAKKGRVFPVGRKK